MAKNKWRCREYTPSGNMTGSHSFYAEAVITTDLTQWQPARGLPLLHFYMHMR